MDKVETERHPVRTAYHLVVTAELTPDEEEGGYSVYCPELDIYTQGETLFDWTGLEVEFHPITLDRFKGLLVGSLLSQDERGV